MMKKEESPKVIIIMAITITLQAVTIIITVLRKGIEIALSIHLTRVAQDDRATAEDLPSAGLLIPPSNPNRSYV